MPDFLDIPISMKKHLITKYREILPENCPPDSAAEITSRRYVYRLVQIVPPSEKDFESHRAQKPDTKFSGVSECQARGLSVYSTKHEPEKLLKLSKFRTYMICRVTLDFGAGRIQQTGKHPTHHTWWPFAQYDLLANCNVEGK